MNGKRRLAFVSAVNIDGSQSKDFDRTHGTISDPFDDENDGEEASELWFPEDRIHENEQTPRDFYQGQTTYDAHGNKITNKKAGGQHLNRMFQQGHLTRRQDPIWGTDEDLIKFANSDTFHVTNCAPQVGFFNMGVAKPRGESLGEAAKKAKKKKNGHPGGQLYWRALEDYVLTNARADRAKISVFTGPIFDDKNDFDWDRGRPDMKGFKAPRSFWKLILRVDDGTLHATALLADQAPLIDYLPEFIMRGEAAIKVLPFEKVAKYHASIAELEKRTGLRFGNDVRSADTYVPKGNGEARNLRKVEDISEISLTRTKPAKAAKAKRKAKRKSR
jgi:endonuclease G